MDDGDTAAGHITTLGMGPFEYSARHYSEKGVERIKCSDCGLDSGYKNGIEHMICSHSDEIFSVSMGFWSIDSDNNFSCSVSGGVHIIAGVSFSVGFSFSEFIERLFD